MAEIKRLFRKDSWSNVFTGLGIRGRDKNKNLEAIHELTTTDDLEHIYASDDMASDIVDEPVDDALKKGYSLDSAVMDAEEKTAVIEYMEDSGYLDLFTDAAKWGRMYGGAALIVNVDDGSLKASEPVRWAKIRRIRSVMLVHRGELIQQTINNDPDSDNFGMPDTYRFSSRTTNRVIESIHYTRIIRFDGAKLPRQLFIQNGYWHDSVLNKITPVLKDFNVAHRSIGILMGDWVQSIYKIKGLAGLIESGNAEVIYNRLDMVEQSRAQINATVMDAENEEFERKGTSLTGLSDVIDRVNGRLVAASNMPHTKILGESPSGLGATGESEQRDYADKITAMQTKSLKKPLQRLLRFVFLSSEGPTKGVEPERWNVSFPPFKQLSEKEESERMLKDAQRAKILIDAGVIDPDEAVTMYSGPTYTSHITVDEKTRIPIDDGKDVELEE